MTEGRLTITILSKQIYQIPQFKNYPELIHGFSTKIWGSLGNPEFENHDPRLVDFLAQLQVPLQNCVAMNQVHGDHIEIVDQSRKGLVILQTDGLITREPNLYLLVKTADCLPVIFYDPKNHICGLAHIGWRGVRLDLAGKMVTNMVELGAEMSSLIVAIGPHIGDCCYDVPKDQADQFRPEYEKAIKIREDKIYLDLGEVLTTQLISSKVKEKNIYLSEICTSCQFAEYFSYHRGNINLSSKTSVGNFTGVVGMKNI